MKSPGIKFNPHPTPARLHCPLIYISSLGAHTGHLLHTHLFFSTKNVYLWNTLFLYLCVCACACTLARRARVLGFLFYHPVPVPEAGSLPESAVWISAKMQTIKSQKSSCLHPHQSWDHRHLRGHPDCYMDAGIQTLVVLMTLTTEPSCHHHFWGSCRAAITCLRSSRSLSSHGNLHSP